jgi:ABC-type transport system substrate-binding protein
MHYIMRVLGIALAVFLIAAPAAGQGQAAREGKPGGVLRLVLREDLPQGFAIHETATNSVPWPAMPCYSNLVIFDQTKPIGRVDTIVPELAERWSWQDNYRNLVFFMRKDARWHDGQPVTTKDVKFTFDLVREAHDPRAVPAILAYLAPSGAPAPPSDTPHGPAAIGQIPRATGARPSARHACTDRTVKQRRIRGEGSERSRFGWAARRNLSTRNRQ